MGIPLAALAIQQPPSLLDQAGKALQLKSLAQNQQYQSQSQPLELEERKQQLETQKRQMADLDAGTRAMNKWSSGKLEDLPDLVRQEGGSFNAVMAAHKQVFDQKEQASKIAEQDANTGSKLVETYQKKADQVSGELSGAKDIPDEQLHDWATGKITELAHSGLIDQPHAQQMLQGLQQTQNPAMIRQGLDHYSKSILGASALATQAQKEQETKKAAAETKKAETEESIKAKELAAMGQGGAVGTGLDVQEANAWLKKNPGKDLADYQKYKATLVPAFNFNLANNTGAPGAPTADTAKRFGMTPVAFDQAAEKYWSTGVTPPIGRGNAASIGLNKAIMNRAAELHPSGSLAANSAEYKANSAALGKVQTQADMVEAFENTAIKNLDQVLKAAESIPDVGVKFANIPIRALESKVIGTENMARLNAALLTGRTESARVLNSANATGVLTNEARQEVDEILGGNMTYPAMKAAVDQLKVDMGNRKQSYRDQLADIKQRLGGGEGGGGSAKSLTQAQLAQAAKDHNVSIEEATRQAKAAGYEVKP